MIFRLVLDAALMAASASGLGEVAVGVVLVSALAAAAAWLVPPPIRHEPPRRGPARP